LQTEDISSATLSVINPSFLQISTQEVTQKADSFLNIKADSIVDKTQMPPSNNKHDFFSLSPYYWQDTTKPNGLPYVLHDGKTNPESASIPDKQKLTDMIYGVKMLSLAYHFTNDVKYATKARELIHVWFLNNTTSMNPNLQYAEVQRGINNGSPSGIMSGMDLPDVLILSI
jgi:hypothetical protein